MGVFLGCGGNDRRVLLDITVEIEGQCAEHIEMKEGDTAESVAKKFCRRQCLPDLLVAPLTDHIVSNIISIRCVGCGSHALLHLCAEF